MYPGKFIIELSSYLFRKNNRMQKQINEKKETSIAYYKIINIDDFYAFSIDIDLADINYVQLQSSLMKLVEDTDEFEEKMTKGYDEIVFG